MPESAREQVCRHGAALEAFVDAYTVGRGKAVDRDALEAMDAVGDNFIDEVSVLANQIDDDPDALLERVPDTHRFGSRKTEKLRECLRDEGYLDPRPKQPDEQIQSAVVETYCQHGLEPTAATAADSLVNYCALLCR